MNIDDVISLYVGKVVCDDKYAHNATACSEGTPRGACEQELERDTRILEALHCAQANGLIREE